jgi:hypothetical protein
MFSTIDHIKKISFAKLEEKENSVPLLIQKGELDEIKEYFDQNQNRW